jgi:hypothetical protein
MKGISMKEYIKNLSVGSAILSMVAGIAILTYNIQNYFTQYYEFNALNAIIIVLSVLVLHGVSIMGKCVLNLKKR